MFHKIPVSLLFCTLFSLFITPSFAQIDKTKYITIDEIKPGMDAYCLTVYQGVEPKKYNLKVVSTIKNYTPNRNAILVIGTDEEFIHSGPVAGCSGSPVYIDGRLAGALAFGWTFSKDPLYGVTPIDEMLEAGKIKNAQINTASCADFSKPINLKDSYQKLMSQRISQQSTGGAMQLACPIATTLPQSSFSNLNGIFESAGFIPVSAGSASGSAEYKDVTFKPGGIIALPLVYGDIDLSAIGTITEVADNKVYAFGHNLLGHGPIDVPMATGYVHTVVSSLLRSFKYGQSLEIKGALYNDQSVAVVGEIGKQAKTIPLQIKIERYNDKPRTYNCRMAVHNYFTPLLTATCLVGTATMVGDLPPELSVRYKARIGINGFEPVVIENFSSSNDLQECASDIIGALNLVMTNPYERPQVTSIDLEINIQPRSMLSHIWAFELSKTTVKPGQTITAQITLESFLGENKTYTTEFAIPQDTPEGNYTLTAGGSMEYMMFLARYAPYKFTPENFPNLIKILNQIGSTKRNALYVMLALPSSGIAIENSQLPNLPVTKSLLLKNDKRALSVQPDAEWIEKTIPVDTIVLDSKNFMISVEK